jgi:hypothetical protein
MATLGRATKKLDIMCLRVLVHQGGWLPSKFPRWFPPEETHMISKQVQAIHKKRKKREKREKKASYSSLLKSRDITKVFVQAVLTRGKSPSTPEATPQQ